MTAALALIAAVTLAGLGTWATERIWPGPMVPGFVRRWVRHG